MRLAVTVEVLLLGAAASQRALPQLAQVRVDVAVIVAGSTEGIGEGGRDLRSALLSMQNQAFISLPSVSLQQRNEILK